MGKEVEKFSLPTRVACKFDVVASIVATLHRFFDAVLAHSTQTARDMVDFIQKDESALFFGVWIVKQ